MTKKNITLNASSVQSRLALCAAALAGTAAAVPTAEATIITNNTPFAIPATTAGIYLNFLTGVAGASAGATPGWDFNPYLQTSSGNLGFYWAQTPAASSGGVATSAATGSYLNLAPGTSISGASTFSQAIGLTAGNPFLSNGTHILGFRFFNEATGVINFGYLTMTNGGANGFPATITSYSYENNGGAITVVPEPSTTALLALTALVLGAVGVRQWRRQQAA
ncbi:MAG: PEP-CTERM sorting domain-containing protein [Chthoniobacterales bacterium]